MADRIVILDRGEVAQIGTPEEVYNHPGSEFVAAFMGAENLLGIEASSRDDRIEVAPAATNGAATLAGRGRQLPGGPMRARFRPEAASLAEAKADDAASDAVGAIRFLGNVVQTSYPGGLWRHIVRVGERQIVVDAPKAFEAGSPILVSVPEEALFLFPEEGSGQGQIAAN